MLLWDLCGILLCLWMYELCNGIYLRNQVSDTQCYIAFDSRKCTFVWKLYEPNQHFPNFNFSFFLFRFASFSGFCESNFSSSLCVSRKICENNINGYEARFQLLCSNSVIRAYLGSFSRRNMQVPRTSSVRHKAHPFVSLII